VISFHSGGVQTTGGSPTPSVQYQYDDGAAGTGVAQYVRQTDLIYPNGRDVTYGYGSAGAVDYIMRQLATISDSATTGGEVAAYTYLGAGQIASESYVEPQVKLDYSGTNNNFSALDRFGNILDQVWASYGGASGNLSTPLDGYQYTYNADGDRLTQANLTDTALSETYTYDPLDRLTAATRTNGQSETWGLDSLGNFVTSSENGTGQTRQTDASNEITSINGSAATSAYDLAGNMTTTPSPGNTNTGLTCVYDAWNRLVEVLNGSTIVAQYGYDGTGRMVEELSNFDSNGNPGTVTYSFYSGQNAIETRSANFSVGEQPTPASTAVQYQYVFSPVSGKTPILRDGSSGRIYYLSDANSNVTAVVGLSGSTWAVAERYVYSAYGSVTVYSPDYSTVRGTSLSASTVGNTIGFANMVFDPVTGLYHDEARWYSTVTSTFITADPAQADLNTYRYCGNDPTGATDPSGMVDFGSPPYSDHPGGHASYSNEFDTSFTPVGNVQVGTVVPGTLFEFSAEVRPFPVDAKGAQLNKAIVTNIFCDPSNKNATETDNYNVSVIDPVSRPLLKDHQHLGLKRMPQPVKHPGWCLTTIKDSVTVTLYQLSPEQPCLST
jgi:RHS repeat-associated protein